MSDRLLLLGTGTCQLEAERCASAVLIEVADSRLVFDFGRGVTRRLVELGLRQDDVEHVVISHFHPDHVSDLIPYLHAASHSPLDPRGRDLTIWGPVGLRRLIEGYFELFGYDSLVVEERFRVRIEEVSDRSFAIAGRQFVFSHLPPAGNHGLKFSHRGRSYALTGDSHFHPQEVEFLRGVELAVIDSGHLSDEEIVALAVQSGARRLVCSHLYRELDEEDLGAQARREGFGGRILVGRDLMEFAL